MSFLLNDNPDPADTLASNRRYRFVAHGRVGKWYRDLAEAQRHSARIGAGFYDERTGSFFAYHGTRLEISAPDTAREEEISTAA